MTWSPPRWPWKRAIGFLLVHGLVNSCLITALALGHGYAESWRQPTWVDTLLLMQLIWLEAWLLTWLPWGLLLFYRWLPRTVLALATVAISAVPLFYMADVACLFTLRDHLLTPQSLRILTTVIAWLPAYTRNADRTIPVLFAFGYLALQMGSIWGAAGATRSADADRRPFRKRWIQWSVVGFGAMILLFAALPLSETDVTLRTMAACPARHPLSALLNLVTVQSEDTRPLTRAERRLTAHLLKIRPALSQLETDYQQLQVVSQPDSLPDVLLIVIETLRREAFTEDVAPQISAFGERGLRGTHHFSGGNVSHVGLFSLLAGLDPVFFQRGYGRYRPALPKLLGQAGYYRAFFGTGDFTYLRVDTLLVPTGFEQVRHWPHHQTVLQGDRRMIGLARRLLDRQGEFEPLAGRPVFCMLFVYLPHFPYESDPLHQNPPTPGAATLPPWTADQLPAIRDRYRNSIRTVDAYLAPLLHDDRVVMIVGDHGESFGEDGTFLHAGTLSRGQTQTPLILNAPGRTPRTLTQATCHADLLPTLLDALGLEINAPQVLSGRSLYAEPEERTFGALAYEKLTLAVHQSPVPPAAEPRVDLDLWRGVGRLRHWRDENDQPADGTEDAALEITAQWLQELLRGTAPQAAGWGSIAEDPYPAVIQALEASSADLRRRACQVAGRWGAAGQPLLPALQQRLADPRNEVRAAALEAITRIQNADPESDE